MNVFQYAAVEERNFEEYLSAVSGYERKYTFVSDLAIADFVSGSNGIRETYKSVVKSWLSDYKAFTEFVMSLNIRSWQCANHYAETDEEKWRVYGLLYGELYYKAKDLFYETYGDDKEKTSYFFNVTD